MSPLVSIHALDSPDLDASDEIWRARVHLAAANRLAVYDELEEGIDNHFTMTLPGRDDRFMVLPFGRHWSEARASDLIVFDETGNVLVGEGSPSRVKSLVAQEKKRVARLVGDTPIYEMIVGNEEGQVPLPKLQQRLMKLPRNIGPAQIDSIENRLAALASRGNAMPKGPVPQGAKMRNVSRAMRRAK